MMANAIMPVTGGLRQSLMIVQQSSESARSGLDVYPINTLQVGHGRAGGGYETFADAVEACLKNHQ